MSNDAARSLSAEISQPMKPRKLMLVMDEEPEFFALVSSLRESGWEVLICRDAVSAQGGARTAQPSVILVGEHLPGGGAATLITRLKRNVHTASIPVLGVAQSGTRGDAAFADADGCVPLETHVDELCRILDGLLGDGKVPLTAPTQAIEDPDRLASLRATNLLDETFDTEIDGLTEIAAHLLDVPVALLSLVEHDRQYFKSFVGLEDPWASRRQTDLPHSFCQWVVSSDDQLTVEDAREHPVLSRNLAVRDLGVTAYAGVPVRSAFGHALGSMCVIDSKPRNWNEHEVKILRWMSNVIEAHSLVLAAEPTAADQQAALHTVSRGVRGGVQLMREGWSDLYESHRLQMLSLVDQFSARIVALTI